MPTTLTVTEAARNFSEVINRAYYKHESMLLTKGGNVVARIVPVERRAVTGRELAALWKDAPHLECGEAEAFARDLDTATGKLPALRDPWA